MERHQPQDGKPRTGQECLTFALGAEEYGIDILKVHELRCYEKPTLLMRRALSRA